MKRLVFACCLLLCISTSIYAQEKDVLRLDSVIRDEDGERTKIEYVYNKDGQIANETKYAIRKGNPYWQLDSKTEYLYSTTGHVIEQNVYSFGNEGTAELWRKYEFVYDTSGLLQRSIYQAVDDHGNCSAYRKREISRNNKGKRSIEIVENLNNGIWITSYTNYVYDKTGKLVTKTDSIDNKEAKRVSYKYGRSGKLREMRISSNDEVTTEKYRFKNGNITQLSRTRNVKGRMERSTIRYTYDHQGSLVQKITDENHHGYTYIQSYTYLPSVPADAVLGIKDNSVYDSCLPGENIQVPCPLLSTSTFLESERLYRADFFYSYIK